MSDLDKRGVSHYGGLPTATGSRGARQRHSAVGSQLLTVGLTAMCTYAAIRAWDVNTFRLEAARGGSFITPTRWRGAESALLGLEDSSPFGWRPCSPLNGSDVAGSENGESARFYCGTLTVPLDYTNASDPRTVKLAVTKYVADPSSKKKSERTLVLNPGGPGGSGGNIVYRKGQQFNELFTDGKYDVLSWDPRGASERKAKAGLGC